jgi:glycosyltransferase involved in cell wall biosynthesis
VQQFAARLDGFRPDIVHIHEVFPLVSPWILPQCTRRSIPVVMTCVDYRLTCPVVTHIQGGSICTQCTGGREHRAFLNNCRGNIPESFIVAVYNFLARRLRLFSDHVSCFIAPSEFTRGWLIDHADLEPSRIRTISPVVEIPGTAADPATGEYVAFAGRFSPEKGIDTLLQAARLCSLPVRLCRSAHSLVRAAVHSDISGLEVVVTRNRAELDAFYRRARMLVLPSVWFETFGLVGAEAMSHGIPVIASRIGALGDLIEDGVDGLVFTPGNAGELAEKIRLLWNDPELCRRLGRAARTKAAALWSPECHMLKLERVYEDVRAYETTSA